MQTYRLTPWAVQQMRTHVRETIEAAEPADFRVSIGFGVSGWTCRIYDDELRVVGEAYDEVSIIDAFGRAYIDMGRRIA